MTTLKGIFPNPKPPQRKNFIQENVKNLRRMEQYFHATKEVEDLDKLKIQKRQNKYQNIAARVNSSLQGSRRRLIGENHSAESRMIEQKRLQRKSSAPELTNVQINVTATNKTLNQKPKTNSVISGKQRKTDSNQSKGADGDSQASPKVPLDLSFTKENGISCDSHCDITKYKSKGIQTLDTDKLSGIYSQGTVRYPSSRSTQGGEESKQETDKTNKSPNKDVVSTKIEKIRRKSESSPPKESVDYVKLNKEKVPVGTKMVTQLSNGVLPLNYKRGVVPKYIKERKEERQHEKERKALEEAILAECPKGHVPLPDNERKETLKLLKKNYQEFVNELNMLPIRSDTLRSQRRKMEIEKQLTKLEEGIKVFSRPKVFVKINA